jgi:hypothetical protein
MTVLGALSSFRKSREMSPHKRAIILRYATSELLEDGRLVVTYPRR